MTFDSFMPWVAIMPELTLAVAAMMLLLIGVFNGDKSTRSITVCSVLVLLVVAFTVWALQAGLGVEDQGVMVTPGGFHTATMFSSFLKFMIIGAAVLCLLIAPGYLERKEISQPEYPVLILFSVVGMMLMVSASHFLMLYIGLELQSLALYVLAAFRRDATRSSEAGLKYFVLGALASGLLLYGVSLVYGLTGTLSFAGIADIISTNVAVVTANVGDVAAAKEVLTGVTISLAFILAALAFKVSAAPFHMWTPDVYEGAPTTVTAFFSVVPKLAAMGLLVQVLLVPFGSMVDSWQPLLVVMAGLSMIVGALGAIGQTNIKRLLAYSSIGHVGFALMALACNTNLGIEALLLYMAFYVVMSLGAFSIVLLMRRDGHMLEEISELSGISRLHPGMAAAMAILMFSMAGIPPMVGFFTKLYVFVAALNAGLFWLALIGAISSVVGAYYYIRIIKVMYFDEPVAGFDQPAEASLSTTVVATSVLTLAGVILMGPLGMLAKMAADSLLP